jgi:hypothetical protein
MPERQNQSNSPPQPINECPVLSHFWPFLYTMNPYLCHEKIVLHTDE